MRIASLLYLDEKCKVAAGSPSAFFIPVHTNVLVLAQCARAKRPHVSFISTGNYWIRKICSNSTFEFVVYLPAELQYTSQKNP